MASGDQSVLFGRTQGEIDWIYPLSTLQNLIFGTGDTSLPTPERRIELAGADVVLSAGSVVDLSGGGDLLAYEFVPGPGGSTDILDPVLAGGAFAVLPTFNSDYAPLDVLESRGFDIATGTRIEVADGSGLPAGQYTVLPPRYALLPGAFLLTPREGTLDTIPGAPLTDPDGAALVAGRFAVAGSEALETRWTAFRVEDGTQVRERAEFVETTGNTFFAEQALAADEVVPLLPRDAGSLVLDVDSSASLLGSVLATGAEGGRGGRLDVAAGNIAIVDTLDSDSDAVQLLASQLSGIAVDSVLVGGTRRQTDEGTVLDTRAEQVTIADGVTLTAPEIVLAGEELVIGTDVTLTNVDADLVDRGTVTAEGDGALVVVSAADVASFERRGADDNTGQLTIGEGSVLEASGALILESTGGFDLQGVIRAPDGTVTLAASRIGLGDAADGTQQEPGEGLVLSADQINALDTQGLVLQSGSSIDIFGELALDLGLLELRAAGLTGQQAAGDTAQITVNELVFSNPFAAALPESAVGEGSLVLVSDALLFAEGAYTVEGFSSIAFDVAGAITASGEAQVGLAADTAITTGALVADAGADFDINAGDSSLVFSASASPALDVEGGFGAQVAITAGEIDFATYLSAPSGSVRLEADTVRLQSGAVIDAAGGSRDFGDIDIASNGGVIALTASNGDLSLASGSRLDVSAGAGASAGRIALTASAGEMALDAEFAATGQGGEFLLDALALDDFSALNSRLNDGAFDSLRAVQVRSGNLTVAESDVVRADRIALTASSGQLSIEGRLEANGGSVDLSAAQSVALLGVIDVSSADAAGGEVVLSATDRNGRVRLATGSLIDMGGGAETAGGRLRVSLNEAGGGFVSRFTDNGAINGASQAVFSPETAVEANSDTITAADIEGWLDDQAADFDPGRFGFLGEASEGLPWTVRPGLRIEADGDVTIAGAVDLVDRRFPSVSAAVGQGDQPGILTIESAGSLTLDGGISDGVRETSDFAGQPIDALQEGPSWSLALIAGTSAGSDADLTLTDGTVVRTGSGDIDVLSSGSLILNDGASIYTTGLTTGPGTLPQQLVDFVFPGIEYAAQGGNLTVDVGADILASPSGQLVNNWLYRAGGASDTFGEVPTLWGVFVRGFEETFGALGGGNVSIRAGGNIENVSASIPTSARHVGDATLVQGTTQLITENNRFEITGGGDLQVVSGGDVVGGVLYASDGALNVDVRGEILADDNGRGLVLALGDSVATVTAGGDVEIEGVLNPTALPQSADQGSRSQVQSAFFTYSESTTADVVSLAGDVLFDNDRSALATESGLPFIGLPVSLNLQDPQLAAISVYPGTVRAAALTGDVRINGAMTLFPTPNGNLDILAFGDVADGGSQTTLIVSDADPRLLPTPASPDSNYTNIIDRLPRTGRGAPDLIRASVPVHLNDDQPSRIVALTGSVQPSSRFTILSSEAIEIRAARDISNIELAAQNVRPDDVTVVSAGRDVRFFTTRNANGRVSNLSRRLEIAGPGRMDVLAGRNIDLGSSDGIVSLGDRLNAALADEGSDVALFAGLSTGATVDNFITTYFVDGEDYQAELEAFVLDQTGMALEGDAAVDAFVGLSEIDQRPLVLDTLFNELRLSGEASVDPEVGFDQGFAAIDALFPESVEYAGDLRIFFSRVQTTDGGDIAILVPGGEVNAGLAAVFEGAKPADELGIVAQGRGDIDALVRDDFQVNQSRVFALDGGDILIWSSEGDIDAGRGAKTALAAPEPLVTVDNDGNIVVTFPATISGSGIRAGVSSRDLEPGDVFLFAPAGVVSAGDAGIGSAGNVTIAATEVIGADNIDVGGTAIGVPVDTGGVAAGLAGVSSVTAGAANAATEQVGGDGQDGDGDGNDSLGDAALAWLDVFLLGFGEEDAGN
ncbi:MAG: filamentous hemagglutinin family protein [Pseudomonadota bacterium]